jgi:hypothetical protein
MLTRVKLALAHQSLAVEINIAAPAAIAQPEINRHNAGKLVHTTTLSKNAF